MPIISVIIPTYNSARYLPSTIDSILSQDFDNLEIIIVDDNSTDNTKEVIKKIGNNKIRYICLDKNHGGPSKPRNIGIKNANGKYIAFCDSDDMYCPGRIRLSLDFLSQNSELGLVFTNEIKFNDHTGENIGVFLDGYDLFWSLPKRKIRQNHFVIEPKYAYDCLFYENYIMPSGVTLRASVLKKVGYFDDNLKNADDWDMWFRITHEFPIGFINIMGFKYRIRNNSISSRGPVLATNRSIVVRKRLAQDVSVVIKKRCHELISINYYQSGYYYQTKGEMKKARKYFFRSIIEFFNWASIRGIFISLLGKKIYLLLKKKLF